MIETKLTSIRLELKTLEKIEACAAKHRYWKRSAVINNILSAVFENFSEREIYDMMRTYNWTHNVVDCKFEITDVLRPKNTSRNG